MARKKTTPAKTTKKAPAKTVKEEQPKVEESIPPIVSDEVVDAAEGTASGQPPVDEVDNPASDPPEKSPVTEVEETAVKPKVSRGTLVQVKTAQGVRTAVLGSKAIFSGQVHTVPYGTYRNSFAPGKFLIRYPDSTEFVAENQL